MDDRVAQLEAQVAVLRSELSQAQESLATHDETIAALKEEMDWLVKSLRGTGHRV